jgi:hypothetical protein
LRRLVPSLLLAAALSAACETVDLGTPPADVNACQPGRQFFIDDIWPMILAKDYAGKHCYDSQCHGSASTNSLKLAVPVETGALPFPTDWESNYRATSQQMNCSNVAASKLLMIPTSANHGGGMLFTPTGPEAMLIQMWVTQP